MRRALRKRLALLRQWGGVAKDIHRCQPAGRPAWLRAMLAGGWALGLMLGLPRGRHLAYALAAGKGLGWLWSLAPCNPWFHLQLAGPGRLATAWPERKTGYRVQVFPMARPLCFEFDAPAGAKAALKLPLWASRHALAEITVLEKSAGQPWRQAARSLQAVPRESPDGVLRIDLPPPADAARRFRIYLDFQGRDGFVNLINTLHPLGHGLQAVGHGRPPKVSVVAPSGPEGNLAERLRGQDYPGEIETPAPGGRPSGDLVLLLDGQGIPCPRLVSEHVFSHLPGKAEAVAGPCLESADADRLEADVNARCREAWLRDRTNPASFVNVSPRNLSLKRPVFEAFAEAGLELGVRLYGAGARVVFNPDAYVLAAPPLAAGADFAGLVRDHPELGPAARRPPAPLPKAGRPLRILTYRWHPAHQYEIYKTGHSFDLAVSRALGLSLFTEQWEYGQRPLPPNAAFVDLEKVDFRDYDLALLHFDENVLDHQNTHGAISENFGASFRHFMDHVPLPKVAVCHGTPQFHGMYDIAYDGPDLLREIAGTRERLVRYLGGTPVICNSHQAQREWGFNNARVIWHGFDPAEFPEAIRNKGILTMGGSLKERPHYRGYFFHGQAVAGLPPELLPSGLKVEEPANPGCKLGNEYAREKFRNYVDAIREYSIYFNPTLRSPMPRSRGEAMMCGLATVSANNHDVDLFIENGKNGFYADTPAEAGEYLSFLATRPAECERMGRASRRTAADVFNRDRFLREWLDIFRELAG